MSQAGGLLSGYLDDYGNPVIKIKVYGVVETAQQEFEATIDTGFSGFLMMPIRSAYPLTLTLMSSADYELADGTLVSKLLAYGTVAVGEESVSGAITLEQSNDCGLLLGMDYLRKSARSLWVYPDGALLIPFEAEHKIKRALDLV